ncbi:PPOX class F420-dependent enzyme [Candidatus Marsarchaeota G1 archaeon OSP_D]|jgi:PPOX class probable F420-dependent enzyme|uniref:PPOX class F420-dependent enzyme n=3 Tax=Candidatus Marsarchaeota group 1 TaxID=2203770 RepID=A0A2R6ACW3_9ARCH|nr:MAG: PPOX class F420-dependent enzyme [Candidatus Marsarchaeota G1 archaeon OSP_D]PSN84178.1 MAG: PPOX class F420-dependent enzyme [Candidatus Marsarchaeota G1 archaeon BE_D]PSN87159.1 MAG: PPOX class F420-dependent enzyme [Candidatus Marsarchaeota G1 archaeon OSP_C]
MPIEEKARKIIEGKNFGFLATIKRDGSPQITPVWVDHDGEHVLVNTTKNRAKTANAKRDPRVALAIVEHENPYSKVVIYGRVVEITENGANEHIDKLAKKYLGKEKYPWSSHKEKRVIMKIKPEKIVY